MTEAVSSERIDTERSKRRRGPLWREPDVVRVVLALVLLVAWELSSGPLVKPLWVSSPSAIAERLWQWGGDGILVESIRTTMTEVFVGGAIGVAVGTAVAIVLGTQRAVAEVLKPIVGAAYAFPQLTLAPLYVVWFGFYLKPKIVLVAVVVFFVMFFNVFEGVRESSPRLLAAVRVMGGGPLHTFRLVIWPTTLYFVATGLRHAIPYGLRAAVFGELIGATSGLGHQIGVSYQLYDSAGVFAALAVLVVIAVLLNAVLDVQQRRLASWSPSAT